MGHIMRGEKNKILQYARQKFKKEIRRKKTRKTVGNGLNVVKTNYLNLRSLKQKIALNSNLRSGDRT